MSVKSYLQNKMQRNGFMAPTKLDMLLESSETAKKYFASLPEYVRGAVIKNSAKISTEDELRRFADNMIHDFT